MAYRRRRRTPPARPHGPTVGLAAARNAAVERFKSLSPSQLGALLERWAATFGSASATYAERSYSDWRAGYKRITAPTASKLLQLVPFELPLGDRVAIARMLRQRPLPGPSVQLRVNEPEDLDVVRRVWERAIEEARPELVSDLPDDFDLEWFDDEVIAAVLTLERAEEESVRREAEPILERLRKDLAGTAPRPGVDFTIPTVGLASIRVLLLARQHRLRHIAQVTALGAFWVLVLSGIGTWVYLGRPGADSGPSLQFAETQIGTPTPALTSTHRPPTATSIPPTATSTPPPTPTLIEDPCGGPPNPWGFTYCEGALIYSPPRDLCRVYYSCILSFWESTNGYVIQCQDGRLSHSGGRRGSC